MRTNEDSENKYNTEPGCSNHSSLFDLNTIKQKYFMSKLDND